MVYIVLHVVVLENRLLTLAPSALCDFHCLKNGKTLDSDLAGVIQMKCMFKFSSPFIDILRD